MACPGREVVVAVAQQQAGCPSAGAAGVVVDRHRVAQSHVDHTGSFHLHSTIVTAHRPCLDCRPGVRVVLRILPASNGGSEHQTRNLVLNPCERLSLTEFLTEDDSPTDGLQGNRRTESTSFWDVSSTDGPQVNGRTIGGGLRIWRLGVRVPRGAPQSPRSAGMSLLAPARLDYLGPIWSALVDDIPFCSLLTADRS